MSSLFTACVTDTGACPEPAVAGRGDGDGKRVEKSSGTIYWYGMGGEVLDESDLSGNITDEYAFFAGKRIAHRDSGGNIFYYFEDHLGTSRIMVQAGQSTACYDADFYPFGGERVYVNTCPQNYKFTGKERDSESGLDDFGARYFGSSLGRSTSVDPVEITPARLRDPQQLNLYSYALNDPANNVDPTGLTAHKLDIVNYFAVYYGGDPTGGGNCELNGIVASCDILSDLIYIDVADPCPANMCSGFARNTRTGEAKYVQYRCTAGGPCGFLNPDDLRTAYAWGGQLYTPEGWAHLIAQGVDRQRMAVALALAQLFAKKNPDAFFADPDNIYDALSQGVDLSRLIGGNYNFGINGGLLGALRDTLGLQSFPMRFGTVHFKDYSRQGFGVVVHLDSADPSGFWGALVHAIVDGLGGWTIYTSVPIPR